MIKFKVTKVDIRTVTYKDVRNRVSSRVNIFEKNNPNAQPIAELFSGHRHNRPYVDYREQVMPEVLKQMGLPKNAKYKWSQKAGCACGCSPGFIVKGGIPKDVYVSVEVFESEPDLIPV